MKKRFPHCSSLQFHVQLQILLFSLAALLMCALQVPANSLKHISCALIAHDVDVLQLMFAMLPGWLSGRTVWLLGTDTLSWSTRSLNSHLLWTKANICKIDLILLALGSPPTQFPSLSVTFSGICIYLVLRGVKPE